LHIDTVVTALFGNGHAIWFNGTDLDGNIQTENVSITGTGTFSTSKWFCSVFDNGVKIYVPTGGNITLSIEQGRWGVVHKEDTSFVFDCRIVIGDGITSTWFIDEDKQVLFSNYAVSAAGQYLIEVKTNGNARFGRLRDATEKTSERGIQFDSDISSAYYSIYYIKGTNVEIYSCSFGKRPRETYYIHHHIRIGSSSFTAPIYNSLLDRVTIYNSYVDIYDVSMRKGLLENIRESLIEELFFVAGTFRPYFGATMTLKNVIAREITTLVDPYYTSVDHYFINVDSDAWTFDFTGSGATNNEFYRQYEFKVNVTDKDGNPISGANVTVSHYGVNPRQDFTVLTGTNGSFATRTLTMGFYNQTGGNTIYDYNPYNITITHTEYQTKTCNFTLNNKINWVITLEPEEAGFPIGFGSGFILGIMIISALGTVGFYSYSKRRR